jgi:SPP1 gp7 family putative phage head morphogenesis protein
MNVNTAILDALTGHSVGLQALSNTTVRKIIALLNRSDARLFERLARDGGGAISRARQEELLNDIRLIVQGLYQEATGALKADLGELAVYEGEFQGDMLRRVVPINLEWVAPSPYQIIAATNARPFQGRLMREWFTDLDAQAFARLRNAIRAGVVEGRTIDQMVRELRGTRAQGFKDGILEINRRAAEVTVRTAVAHTANVARSEMYQANRRFIKAVQWRATLDSRTSLYCMAHDGQVYPVDAGPRPPAHPNCRSIVSPVLKSLAEMGIKGKALPPGTRASMDGQVAADMNYDDWLRKKPQAFQEQVLGKAKSKLFRAGLKLDRFISKAGDELTLDQLKERDAGAWTRAFAE